MNKLTHTLEEFLKDPLGVVAEQGRALDEQVGRPLVSFRLFSKDQLVVPIVTVKAEDGYFVVGKPCGVPPYQVENASKLGAALVLSVDDYSINGYKNVVLDIQTMGLGAVGE